MTLPRMKATVTHLSKLHDQLVLEWNGKSYLTTGRPGAFTRAVITEHKRRYAGVAKEKKT